MGDVRWCLKGSSDYEANYILPPVLEPSQHRGLCTLKIYVGILIIMKVKQSILFSLTQSAALTENTTRDIMC